MRIFLHTGLPGCGCEALQSALGAKRERLASQGVLYPRAPGGANHTRLYMAMSDADHVDPLRFSRGYGSADAQSRLRDELAQALQAEIAASQPDTVILSASQIAASLHRKSEIERLREFLSRFSTDIHVIAHVAEQSRALARHYARQVLDGRTRSLDHELSMLKAPDWRKAALADWSRCAPDFNDMPEVQGAPFWLDYPALAESWETVFGTDRVQLRQFDAELFHSADLAGEIDETFALPGGIGRLDPADAPAQPSAAWLSRARAMNGLFEQALRAGRQIRRPLRNRLLDKLKYPGPPIDPASLGAVSARFAKDNRALLRRHPALDKSLFTPPDPAEPWQEADPGGGFRATQYFTVFLPIIDNATRQERKAAKQPREKASETGGTAPQDTVLELGAGIGFMSTTAVRHCDVRKVVSYEANPALIPYIRSVHRANGVSDRAEVRNALLAGRKGKPVNFFVRRNLLASSLEPRQGDGDGGVVSTEKVEVHGINTVLKEISPSVLLCDIEGAEADLLPKADLSGLRLAIVELHPQWIGQSGVQAVFDAMHKGGLSYFPKRSNGKVVAFRKGW